MTRLPVVLLLYFLASAISFYGYPSYASWLGDVDYRLVVLSNFFLGPLGIIGTYGYSSQLKSFLDGWVVMTTISVAILFLACLRPKQHKRKFWWKVFAIFWLISGLTYVLAQISE
jgi:hypothetical protein